jgi:hypothetical protein
MMEQQELVKKVDSWLTEGAEIKKLLETFTASSGGRTLTEDEVLQVDSFAGVLKAKQMTEEQFMNDCTGLRPHEVGARKVELVCAFFNQDWVADNDNENQAKWYIWYKGGKKNFRFVSVSDYCSFVGIPSWTALKTEKIAKHVAIKFMAEFKQWLIKE